MLTRPFDQSTNKLISFMTSQICCASLQIQGNVLSTFCRDFPRRSAGFIAPTVGHCTYARPSVREDVLCGDDDQAIYRWAGADVEHFINLEGGSETLSQSYRVPEALGSRAECSASHQSPLSKNVQPSQKQRVCYQSIHAPRVRFK